MNCLQCKVYNYRYSIVTIKRHALFLLNKTDKNSEAWFYYHKGCEMLRGPVRTNMARAYFYNAVKLLMK